MIYCNIVTSRGEKTVLSAIFSVHPTHSLLSDEQNYGIDFRVRDLV